MIEQHKILRVFSPELESHTSPQDLYDVPDAGPVKYLIEDFIPQSYPTSLYGDGGQGKSYIAMYIALSVITGRPFLSKRALARGNVLYLDWELDSSTQRGRWGEVARGCALMDIPHGLYHKRLLAPLQSSILDIHNWIDQVKPVLVIVDSVGRAMGGDPLNPGTSIEFMRNIETLGTTLLIDHQARATADRPYASMREYGTSYKGHYVRCSWQLERVGQEEGTGVLGLIFRHKKSNFGPLLNEMAASLTFLKEGNKQSVSLLSSTASQDLSKGTTFGIKGLVLRTLRGEKMTMDQLAESIPEFDRGSISNEITSLKRARLVTEVGKEGKKPIYGLINVIDPRMVITPVSRVSTVEEVVTSIVSEE